MTYGLTISNPSKFKYGTSIIYNSVLDNLTSISSTGGNTGPAGPIGPTGPIGFAGPTGPIGPAGGPQGLIGVQGPTGYIGVQGLIGFQGPTGYIGLQGFIGFQGPTGDRGFQGFIGLQGSTGDRGFQGFIGLQGPTGDRGFQGFIGLQGSTGDRGFQGFIGLQGPTGDRGFQGFIGLQGSTGDRGFQGFIGLQGPTGERGVQGFIGLQGPTGDRGFQGFIGLQGHTGDIGLQGFIGFQGPTGDRGVQGFIGLQGPTGVGFNSILNNITPNSVLLSTGASTNTAYAENSLVFSNNSLLVNGSILCSSNIQANNISSSGTTSLYNLNVSNGITAPVANIQCYGVEASAFLRTGNGSVSVPSISFRNDTDTGLYLPLTGTIGFVVNGEEKMKLGSTGTLNVTSSILATGTIESRASLRTTNGSATFDFTDISSDGTLSKYNAGGALGITYSFDGTEKMRLTSSGNLGIGTTNPLYPLDINSGNYMRSSTGYLFNYGGQFVIPDSGNSFGSVNGCYIYNNAEQFTIEQRNSGGGAIVLRTSSGAGGIADRVRITSNGNVGIGIPPSYQLQLSRDDAAKPSTNTWTISSDRRVKENIINADIDMCKLVIDGIPLRRYGYNTAIKEFSEGNINDVNVIGFIAEEFERYFPKGVTRSVRRLTVPKDFVFEDMTNIEEEPIYIDSFTGGETISEDPNYKTVIIKDFQGLNSSQIIPTLVGAVKKQSILINDLVERIKRLESLVIPP